MCNPGSASRRANPPNRSRTLMWPQVVKRTIEVPKMTEQILDVLVPETVEQLVKLPKTISEDKIQQRTVEGYCRRSSSAGREGTGEGLQGFLSGQG